MIEEKNLHEIVFTQLKKETFISFSERSLNMIKQALIDFYEGKSIKDILSSYSVESKSHQVIKRALVIYQEERSK